MLGLISLPHGLPGMSKGKVEHKRWASQKELAGQNVSDKRDFSAENNQNMGPSMPDYMM
jgi:hypothetical protein